MHTQRSFEAAEADLQMALLLDPGHRNAAAYLEAVQVGRGCVGGCGRRGMRVSVAGQQMPGGACPFSRSVVRRMGANGTC